ncbi:MAG: hypothetical protein ABSF03_11905 [Streptosporangiaceae bacterium]
MNESLPGRGQRARFSHYHPFVRAGASPVREIVAWTAGDRNRPRRRRAAATAAD